ncbi:MAG: hypothetical protein JWQ96_1244 [Segetibacter sp.]|nr:hypothetical protein [Segetibacter sp.]
MKKIKDNGLSLVFLALFILALSGQAITGFHQHNEELIEHGAQEKGALEYLTSGHFLEATFENFESEFLQMGLFIFFSMYFYQKGSSESDDPDKVEPVEREPDPNKKDAPWPVKKGGVYLAIYKYSLGYAMLLLFLVSFLVHWYGSLKSYNEEQYLKNLPMEGAMEYLSNSKLWFECFQNWQSEFLSVFSIVVLSIFLRQKNSAQSKPVDAPDSETGG